MNILHTIASFLFWILLLSIGTGCQTTRNLSVLSYYEYDDSAPLDALVAPLPSDKSDHRVYEVRFSGTHQQTITGILSYPRQAREPAPVIILIHGLGDRANVDYITAGEEFLREAGFAVLRLDLYNHGKRRSSKFDFSFESSTRYRSREIITQSVFDLRRSIDFIESREDLDSDRIGYLGISLGGVIGTIFTAVDKRVKVPVIALAGGGLNLMFGLKAFSSENKNYLSVIDPINYVRQIAPRPLLMINAENDEIIPPLTSKLLFKKARHPKKIIWHAATHRTIPLDKTFLDGIQWFEEHL
ncbi:MAG TPA: alpha/beta fold hydrolase [Membranihabitans sp.]|nr:alpha/beta fold hydrolase [Membranihabitans sp.]